MSFHKTHHFDLHRNIPILAERRRQQSADYIKLYPPGQAPYPSWIAYDGKVLCFEGYYKNSENQYEGECQIRRVKISHFLEDETIQIVEPKIVNSGIPQGCIVKRQRVTERTNNPEDKKFISLFDLNVNKCVKIFDRTYYITGCDSSTRSFLNRLGIKVPNSVPIPPDPSGEMRKRAEEDVRNVKKSGTKNNKYGQFLRHDRKVLRFDAVWDDRKSQFGDLRQLVVHYYLSDDTIEIKERLPVNSGRTEGGGIFLKRMKLPKSGNKLLDIGHNASFTVLNVLGTGFNDGRFIPDAMGKFSKQEDFYTDSDLQIGGELNVFGRNVQLVNCDGFTKEYYKAKFGLEEFKIPEMNFQTENQFTSKPEREQPPFNGWGNYDEEQIDFDKFVKLDGLMLRFGAKLDSRILENGKRVFIISYHLSDDTISVFEVPMRNSGFSGGQFLHRRRFYVPSRNMAGQFRPKPYEPQDFFIGARIDLDSHSFRIVSGDEFAFSYMEKNFMHFPLSNADMILDKIRTKLNGNYKNIIGKYNSRIPKDDSGNQLLANYDLMKDLMFEIFDRNEIVEQEILTICRHFSVTNHMKNHDSWNIDFIRASIHLELTRNLWSDYQNLREYLNHLEYEDYPQKIPTGFLSKEKLKTAIRGVRLPIKQDQIELMFKVLATNQHEEVLVEDFLNFLYIDKDALITKPCHFKDLELNSKKPLPPNGQLIDWLMFIGSLGMESDLTQ